MLLFAYFGVESLGFPRGDRMKKALYFGAGTASLGAGIVGMLIPVWPTTCFLLLAAGCYGRSSDRAYTWMHSNRWFGNYLRGYRDRRTIPLMVKRAALTLLWAGILLSLVLVSIGWVQLLLLGVAGAITWHILSLKTAVPEAAAAAAPSQSRAA